MFMCNEVFGGGRMKYLRVCRVALNFGIHLFIYFFPVLSDNYSWCNYAVC